MIACRGCHQRHCAQGIEEQQNADGVTTPSISARDNGSEGRPSPIGDDPSSNLVATCTQPPAIIYHTIIASRRALVRRATLAPQLLCTHFQADADFPSPKRALRSFSFFEKNETRRKTSKTSAAPPPLVERSGRPSLHRASPHAAPRRHRPTDTPPRPLTTALPPLPRCKCPPTNTCSMDGRRTPPSVAVSGPYHSPEYRPCCDHKRSVAQKDSDQGPRV